MYDKIRVCIHVSQFDEPVSKEGKNKKRMYTCGDFVDFFPSGRLMARVQAQARLGLQ